MRYAILNNENRVVNIVQREGRQDWVTPQGYRAVPCPNEQIGIGYVFEGDIFYATQSLPGEPLGSRIYKALYPFLITFSVLSALTVVVGLGLWLYQTISGQALDWYKVALWGFLGCWVFPGLLIGLGVWVARLERPENN